MKDYLADIMASIYMFDIPKIESSMQAAWDEYQRLLDEAEKTRDFETASKARVYIYVLGYFIPEKFGQGAIERRLNHFEPAIKFDDFVLWVDSDKIPDQYKDDEFLEKLVEFYKILKSYKNKQINGSYLDEDRLNKVIAEIQGKEVSDVAVWQQRNREVKMDSKNLEGREIKGITASRGKCEGKAFVVVNMDEIGEVPEGCVLVAVMTTPDCLPAMKKAIGIVTDFGGVMSHPAIISRELGIPCIVGTKKASFTIRTGDLVRVDANRGTVEILKRSA